MKYKDHWYILRHLIRSNHFLNSIATRNISLFNCDAVGGTLGALVIVLVFLLAGVTAGLVYFIAKEFKCKGREHQPAKPEK